MRFTASLIFCAALAPALTGCTGGPITPPEAAEAAAAAMLDAAHLPDCSAVSIDSDYAAEPTTPDSDSVDARFVVTVAGAGICTTTFQGLELLAVRVDGDLAQQAVQPSGQGPSATPASHPMPGAIQPCSNPMPGAPTASPASNPMPGAPSAAPASNPMPGNGSLQPASNPMPGNTPGTFSTRISWLP